MSNVVNLSYRLGETWAIDATLRDSLNIPIPLGGCTVKWRMSLGGVTLLDLSSGSGITNVNAPGGECLITVTPTMQVAAGVISAYCQHQCRLILLDGSVSDQFAGSFKVLPSLF
jgi:hypothetical protein